MARRNNTGISGLNALAVFFAVTFSVFSSDDKQFNSPPRVTKSETVALTAAAEDKEIVAYCKRVVDGDTFEAELEDGTVATIRLHGLDTPESDQAFGVEATRRLRKLLTGQIINLKINDKDRSGELLATVEVGNLNVNHDLVKAGLAWHYVASWQYVKDDQSKLLAEAEAEAQREKRGLWKDRAPVAPWDWRRRDKAPPLKQLSAPKELGEGTTPPLKQLRAPKELGEGTTPPLKQLRAPKELGEGKQGLTFARFSFQLKPAIFFFISVLVVTVILRILRRLKLWKDGSSRVPAELARHHCETTLYKSNPSMLRNSPVLFSFVVLLCFVNGIGIPILVVWWVRHKGITFTVTNERVTLRTGIFSKSINEVWHRDIRNVRIAQSFFQRLFGVGDVGVSSAGQGDIEIIAYGLPSLNKVKAIIDQHRRSEN